MRIVLRERRVFACANLHTLEKKKKGPAAEKISEGGFHSHK